VELRVRVGAVTVATATRAEHHRTAVDRAAVHLLQVDRAATHAVTSILLLKPQCRRLLWLIIIIYQYSLASVRVPHGSARLIWAP